MVCPYSLLPVTALLEKVIMLIQSNQAKFGRCCDSEVADTTATLYDIILFNRSLDYQDLSAIRSAVTVQRKGFYAR